MLRARGCPGGRAWSAIGAGGGTPATAASTRRCGGAASLEGGWGAGGLYVQHFTLNVGCAFFRPTPNAIELLRRVGSRLARESGWDQQIFNQELFLKSHGEYNGSKASVRVMDHLKWVNSKVYFFSERRRFLPGRPTEEKDLPVMVHMNYHADKLTRMLCVWARYGPKGEIGACDKFPEGS